MPNKNIRPGVCGICGIAVLQPSTDAIQDGVAHGHYFQHVVGADGKLKLQLEKVRCQYHRPAPIGMGVESCF
jgi:hypothetical protein